MARLAFLPGGFPGAGWGWGMGFVLTPGSGGWRSPHAGKRPFRRRRVRRGPGDPAEAVHVARAGGGQGHLGPDTGAAAGPRGCRR